ncbi:Asp-tRNA(Asn)/Glu-tRNA(Gln) amidotransferase subunit GatA [Candidatus Saccharibacteria bacterium]|nr:Asp-tRNA(Asn)/Glu-tRNA(Gln) amidotransferase subunit GatA [Candidatus Saccharibacteria bacterium]
MKTANKTVSAERLVKDALEKAKFFEDYHIFTSLNEEGALKKAREIDAKIKKGEKVGRLAGVPYAMKDNFLSPEGETTAAAHILEGFTAPVTATAIKKLEAEGAIMIGRTNMDAFAHGSSTENSYFGPTSNAFDKKRVAGGSSGGSAVAVALDIVEFATGTDTGGSIRQPASFNGVYGFKPTFGTISRYGVVAMASSTDCIGFFTKAPEDMDLLMSIASGQDPKDLTTLPDYYNIAEADAESDDSRHASSRPSSRGSSLTRSPLVAKCLESSNSCARIGVIKDFDNESVDPEIRQALKKKCDALEKKGHKVVELSMPNLKYALAAYYIIVPAEIASNLSRYDGIRYGFRSNESTDLTALYSNTRSEGFMPENKRRIMIGNFVLSSGFYDAYFLKAAKARTLIIKEYEKAFSKCDFILTPVSPNLAFKIGEKVNDPVSMYLEDVMSVPLNLAGIPGLTIPVGKAKSGLPIGLQLIGPRRSDKSLLEFAKETECSTAA